MADTPHPPRILRRVDVERLTGLGRSTLYQRMEEGIFPKQVPLGGNSVGWLESEVIDWLNARIAERDTGQGRRPGKPEPRVAAS